MHIRWRGLELPSIVNCDATTLTSTYGKFVAEPFERGFGTTIGNSLRRVLLSSLEGSAVTQIKIRGAQHEFSTIPGVLEDVTDTDCTSLRSTSAIANVPLSVRVSTFSPAPPSAISITAPDTSVAAVTVGTSFVPVISTVTVCATNALRRVPVSLHGAGRGCRAGRRAGARKESLKWKFRKGGLRATLFQFVAPIDWPGTVATTDGSV